MQKGKIYIVSTPIGNLSDMTFRAIDTLKNVDLIAAEDTRRTRELLNHFEIKNELTAYHEHNKYDKATLLVNEILNGKNLAIVTDAGTPIISDPGNELVKLAIENEIEITAIPGACAAINALVLSGLDASEFVFIGFLQEDNVKRKKQLETLLNETKTMIFYISPHSLKKDLKSVIEIFGSDRKASIAREMTKKYEEVVRGSLDEINNHFTDKEIKGEFVLVVEGIDKLKLKEDLKNKWLSMPIEVHIEKYLSEGLTEKEAIKKVAKDRDVDKNEIYKYYKGNNTQIMK